MTQYVKTLTYKFLTKLTKNYNNKFALFYNKMLTIIAIKKFLVFGFTTGYGLLIK